MSEGESKNMTPEERKEAVARIVAQCTRFCGFLCFCNLSFNLSQLALLRAANPSLR